VQQTLVLIKLWLNYTFGPFFCSVLSI